MMRWVGGGRGAARFAPLLGGGTEGSVATSGPAETGIAEPPPS